MHTASETEGLRLELARREYELVALRLKEREMGEELEGRKLKEKVCGGRWGTGGWSWMRGQECSLTTPSC